MGKYMGKDWNTVRRETKERGEDKSERDNSEEKYGRVM